MNSLQSRALLSSAIFPSSDVLINSRLKMNFLNFLILSFIRRVNAKIQAKIHYADRERCKEVPVFPYPAENIDCEGFVGYGERCTHRCGDTVIESTCEKVMIDLGRDEKYFTGVHRARRTE